MAQKSSLVGYWQDVRGTQMYVVKVHSYNKNKLRVDVYNRYTGDWKFGGDHLIRIKPDGKVVWGANMIDRQYCVFTEDQVVWFKCGETCNPKWTWEAAAATTRTSSSLSPTVVANGCSCHHHHQPGCDLYAASEYEPDDWVPAKLVANMSIDGDAFLVVSTQDNSNMWTVDSDTGAVCIYCWSSI